MRKMRKITRVDMRGVRQGQVARLGAKEWEARPDEVAWPNLPRQTFSLKKEAEDYLVFGDGSETPKWRQFESV